MTSHPLSAELDKILDKLRADNDYQNGEKAYQYGFIEAKSAIQQLLTKRAIEELDKVLDSKVGTGIEYAHKRINQLKSDRGSE